MLYVVPHFSMLSHYVLMINSQYVSSDLMCIYISYIVHIAVYICYAIFTKFIGFPDEYTRIRVVGSLQPGTLRAVILLLKDAEEPLPPLLHQLRIHSSRINAHSNEQPILSASNTDQELPIPYSHARSRIAEVCDKVLVIILLKIVHPTPDDGVSTTDATNAACLRCIVRPHGIRTLWTWAIASLLWWQDGVRPLEAAEVLDGEDTTCTAAAHVLETFFISLWSCLFLVDGKLSLGLSAEELDAAFQW